MAVSVRVFVVIASVLGVSFVVEFDEDGGGFSGEAAELDEVKGQVGEALGNRLGKLADWDFGEISSWVHIFNLLRAWLNCG